MKLEYMNLAIEQAKLSGEDIPVGCVIVKNGEVVAFSKNEREKTSKITSHAEITALEQAEEKLGNWRLDECEMYVTLEPCPMCAGAIVQARIKNLYFGAYDPNYGAFGSKTNMLQIMNSKIPNVYGGIMEKECKEILNEFFGKMRKND